MKIYNKNFTYMCYERIIEGIYIRVGERPEEVLKDESELGR